MSMFSGLEVRVPYCDYRIAEYLYTVPWEYKDWQGYEKGLLRKAMEGILPDQVRWRKRAPIRKRTIRPTLKTVSARLREVISDLTPPFCR
jgi:asparagine synthase (glutamine-hydrolysing)